jgi:hypothetical protein
MTLNGNSHLTDTDIAMFAKIGVPAEMLDGYADRLTDAEARVEHGIKGPSSNNMQGIGFFYLNPKTLDRWTTRVRRDHPEVEEDGRVKDKYVSAYGDRKHFYFPPGAIERINDPETTIVLVEAEKSALAIEAWARRCERKILGVGMGGYYGWRGRTGKRTNQHGERVDVKGPISDMEYCESRKVIVMLDADRKNNKKLQDARGALVRDLKLRNATTFIANLPIVDGVNGPDDYVGAAGDEAMTVVIERAYQTASYYEYGGGRFEIADVGVYYIGPPDKEGRAKTPLWICDVVRILAATRDANSSAWGRLLEWKDRDGVIHRWSMPMELLQREGALEVRDELTHHGFSISPARAARDHFATFLQVWPIDIRARCVERLGWITTSEGPVYVLPNEAVGSIRETVVFQNAQAIEPALARAGTVSGWKDSVATLAAGNSRLVFAISAAFAGALLDLTGDASGGFHFCGPSSTGKSTVLELAASVWGNPQRYCRRWRATVNGLEALAALHNEVASLYATVARNSVLTPMKIYMPLQQAKKRCSILIEQAFTTRVPVLPYTNRTSLNYNRDRPLRRAETE